MTTPSPASGSADRLEAGTILADRYEIIRRVGTGGMGAVYLARHRQMERLCAIKVLHPSLSGDREALERFTNEARNASRISHPNVCTVYDFGSTPAGLVYLAMEYVDGRSLGAILAERRILSPRQAAPLVREIAAGLDAAHAFGIVHRDLKPDNVMVARAGERDTVKLVDFGIAKALERPMGREVTAPGVVVGTPDYMAPEQFAGDPTDRRSDCYSLALIFYRMVTGALPFTGATARETLTSRLTDRPRPLREVAPQGSFPPELQAVMDRALARRPEERYADAGAFAEALDAALVSLPPDSADSTDTVRLDAPTGVLRDGTPPTRRMRRRLPVALAGAAGIVLAVALLVRSSGSGAPGTARRPDTVAAPPPSVPAAMPESPANRATPPAGAGSHRETAPGPQSPGLPTPEEVLDPLTQDASRARAEQIYASSAASQAVRAQAAFIMATIRSEQGRYADAEAWAARAVIVNDSAPPGAEREQRSLRYEGFLTQVRLKRKEPTTP